MDREVRPVTPPRQPVLRVERVEVSDFEIDGRLDREADTIFLFRHGSVRGRPLHMVDDQEIAWGFGRLEL